MVRIRLNHEALGTHDLSANPPQEHAVIVPVLADHGLDPYVPNGAVIDVPAEIAGHGPRWRRPQPGDDLGFMETRERSGHTEVHDLGSGLLAQFQNWEPVAEAEAKTTDGEG